MPRGVYDRAKAKPRTSARRNGKPVAATAVQASKAAAREDDADDRISAADTGGYGGASGLPAGREGAHCRIDGSEFVHGQCPSCSARAKRFARIAELEAELKKLKVKACSICSAPGARKSKHYPDAACALCRKQLSREARLKAQLAKARK